MADHLCVKLEDFPAAKEYGQKHLAARTRIYGVSHWKTTDARLKLADVELRAKLSKEQRTDLEEAVRLMREARAVVRSASIRRPGSGGKSSVALHERYRREASRLSQPRLNNLAFLYDMQGLFPKAEPFYREALTIRKEVLGVKHPDYAISLNNLAALYESQGLFAKAEPLYMEALAIYKEVLGVKHPDYAASLNNLACPVPPGFVREGRTALQGSTGDQQAGARRQAPHLRPEPEQPGVPVRFAGFVCEGRTALQGSTGDPQGGSRRQAPAITP